MPAFRRTTDELKPGVYDEVVSDELQRRLDAIAATHAIDLGQLTKGSDVDEQLVTLVRDAARIAIEARSDADSKVEVAQRLLQALSADSGFVDGELSLHKALLRSISLKGPGPSFAEAQRPRGSLLSSGLITNAHGESVLEHLASEFASADRIDLLCSFIKLSGLDKFRPLIERHLALGRPFRVLTTTYMRATDAKALEILVRLGATVRVSYDDAGTRLHAKAWIFHRSSQYSTAYVGSSNLSHAAQTEGLEWNVRITQTDQPDLLDDTASVFESYFRDEDKFEPFDNSPAAQVRLRRALSEPETRGGSLLFELEPKAWQKPMLRELEEARKAGRTKNLVVAATGTGKTLVAAFDYQALQKRREVDTLLFVAHRKEILEQARTIFRNVLQRPDFGELWVDGQTPETFQHVFASIQSLDGSDRVTPEHFDHVIIDEVHHAAARTYNTLLDRLEPKQLVGLTATPERADGRVYEGHFPRPYIGNLRVWDAIQQQVLVPFRYFVLDADGLDVSEAWKDHRYVSTELSTCLIQASDIWVRTTCRAIEQHIARPEEVRALAFCVDKAHAAVVADRLTRDAKLSARVLTDETPREERDRAKGDLAAGRVQVLCVVDLFNEGVDIPDVNTLFLFRPTESVTVFLQQLGRGLRRSREKDLLTVFDVTGLQHPEFRFDRHLREMLGMSPRELRDFVEKGFGRIPSGCVLHFEERAKADVLERIKRAIPTDARGLRELLQGARARTWNLATFLEESEVDLLDLYKSKRSWTLARVDAGLLMAPVSGAERDALGNLQKLMHVSDPRRLGFWKELLAGTAPRNEAERRLAAMLLAGLYGPFEKAKMPALLSTLRSQMLVVAELGELLPILEARADSFVHTEPLEPDIPLVLHARYLDTELSAAFDAVTQKEARIRHFYTGVEPVAGRHYDLLLVTMDKTDAVDEHLRYHDFALTERSFQWQSKSDTRQDDAQGRRHLNPQQEHVTPLLFVRDTKKDGRGVTEAFRYLGPVEPRAAHGERPITIEWLLAKPLMPEWVRKWSAAG